MHRAAADSENGQAFQIANPGIGIGPRAGSRCSLGPGMPSQIGLPGFTWRCPIAVRCIPRLMTVSPCGFRFGRGEPARRAAPRLARPLAQTIPPPALTPI